MHVVLWALGGLAVVAGGAMVWNGIRISEFGIGNTLIGAGAGSVIGGLVLVGLGEVVRLVARVAQALEARPFPRAPEAETAAPIAPASAREAPRRAAPSPATAPPVAAAPVPRPREDAPREAAPREPTPREAAPRPARPAAEAPEIPPPPPWLHPDEEPEAAPRPPPAAAPPPGRPAPPAFAESPDHPAPAEWPSGDEPAAAAPARAAPGQQALAAMATPRGFDALWPETQGPPPRVAAGPAAPAAAPPDLPPPLHPPAPEPAEPEILKSGVIDGMAYTLYADGTIDAELPEGVVRFASIEALRVRLERGA